MIIWSLEQVLEGKNDNETVVGLFRKKRENGSQGSLEIRKGVPVNGPAAQVNGQGTAFQQQVIVKVFKGRSCALLRLIRLAQQVSSYN